MGRYSDLKIATCLYDSDLIRIEQAGEMRSIEGSLLRAELLKDIPAAGNPIITVASCETAKRVQDAADLVCDGTNDEEQIKSAIQKIKSDIGGLLSGGRVQLTQGTFYISKPIDFLDTDALSLCGTGPGARSNTQPEGATAIGTRIQAAPDFPAGEPMIKVWHSSGARCLANAQITGLSVDGNNIADTGVLFSSHRGFLHNLSVSLCKGTGIITRGVGTWNTFDTVMLGPIWITDNGGDGIWFGELSFDNHIGIGVIIARNGGHGIRMEGSSHQFTGIHTYGNRGCGVLVNGKGMRTKFINWKCEANGQHGLFVDGTNGGGACHIQVVGANFKDNSASVDGGFNNIQLGGISGSSVNHFNGSGITFDAQGTILVGNHINITAKGQDNMFTGVTYSPNAARNGFLVDMGARNLVNGRGSNGGVPGVTGGWASASVWGAKVYDTVGGGLYEWAGDKWLRTA
jgi:hypothetical protein